MAALFEQERHRIQEDYRKHQARLAEQRRDAEARVATEARQQLSELERRQQEVLGQVRAEQQRRRRLVAIGQRLPRVPVEQEKDRIESEARKARAEVEQARKEALHEIEKATEQPAEELEEWKSEAGAAIDKAEAKFKAQNVELDTGEWVPREDFKELPKEYQDHLKKLGIDRFNELITKEQAKVAQFEAEHVKVGDDLYVTKQVWESLSPADQLAITQDGYDNWLATQEALIREFEADHVEVKPGEWYEKASWEDLTTAQQKEVLDTGQYTPVLTEATGRDWFNELKGEGKIHEKAEYKGIKDNQVVYEIAWAEEVSLLGKALKRVGIPVPAWMKAPAMTQEFLKYVHEQQQEDDTPTWVKNVADSPLMYLTLLPEYKAYVEGRLGEGYPPSAASGFLFPIVKRASEYALAGLPRVTFDEKTDTYGYVATMGGPNWKFPTPSLGTGRVQKLPTPSVAKPQLQPVTVRPTPVRVTKVLSAKDVGMSQAAFNAFVKARAVTPGLTPKTFQFLTTVKPSGARGQQLAKFFFGKAKGAGLSRAEAEAGWQLMKATRMRPLDAIKLGLTKQQQAVTALSEATKAQAFYKGMLPSYAEIIARGLPEPAAWKPWHSVAWQAAKAAETLNPQTFQQAVALAGQTDTQWENMAERLMGSLGHVPLERRREVFGTLGMGLASQAAQAAGMKARAAGLSEAKVKAAVKQAMTKAMQGLSTVAVQQGLLTMGQAQAMSRGMIQPQSMLGLAQSLGLMPVPAHAMAQPTPATQPAPVGQAVTIAPTGTKPVTKRPAKIGVGILDWEKKEKGIREEEARYPDGTIAWKQGVFWKIIPPPYDMRKPINSILPPAGVTVRQGTPQQTLTFIGGKAPFANVAFDLGVSDGFIDVKAKTIHFTGGGLETVVGKRIPSSTKGMTLKDFTGRKITKDQARAMAVEKVKGPEWKAVAKPRKRIHGRLPTKEEYAEHIKQVVIGL